MLKLSENYNFNGIILDQNNTVVCDVNTFMHKDKGQRIVDAFNASLNVLENNQLKEKNTVLLEALKDTREFIKHHNKKLKFGAYDIAMYKLNKAIRENM